MDKRHREKARLLINIEDLANPAVLDQIYGFDLYKNHTQSSLSNLLFINGANSPQINIENDIEFYQTIYPNALPSSLHILKDAGHAVHYEQ